MMKPELDQWSPGEHNGTFRGHNPAFVTATTAFEEFWQDDELTRKVNADASQVRDMLFSVAETYDGDVEVRGRGMIQGVEFENKSLAGEISKEAFQRGLIIETAGPSDEVLKALPPLTISPSELSQGLEILEKSARAVISRLPSRQQEVAATNGKSKA